MITIPAINTGTADAPLLSPSLPIPEGALAVVFGGVEYTVYEHGDTLPASQDEPQ